MAVSAARAAKHALVLLLRSLAVAYGLTLGSLSRDSPDGHVQAAFRRVSLKAHPDKGGSKRDQERLNSARDVWKAAAQTASGRPQGGRPGKADARGNVGRVADATPQGGYKQAGYRIRGTAVLLTYQGLAGPQVWQEFLAFVSRNLSAWSIQYWTATFEANRGSQKCHAHLMLQFKREMDQTTSAFGFHGVRPNASATDLCGQGLCRKKLQQSIDRGHFYVWADKLGTLRCPATGDLCVAANYKPSWTEAACSYRVLGAWPETLWKSHKLSHERYDEYLFACRDGVAARKRNLDLCREKEEQDAAATELEARAKRIRSTPALFKDFPDVPAAIAWKACFEKDALRYPILVVLGPSRSGKTEWAKTLFKNPLELKVGALTHFPEGMRAFNRKRHDALILDDVRDLAFLANHQEKLQGKYDSLVEFASTQGGTCAYTKDLFAVPVVVTINYSTLNLGFLESHDWLGNSENRAVVTLTGPLHA